MGLSRAARALPLVLALLAAPLGAGGCGGPERYDETTPAGTVAALAAALERDARGEAGALREVFRRLEERARHAMHAIAEAGRRRAGIVRRDFPPEQREAELRRIGETDAPDGVALFGRRCPPACRAELRARLGAVVAERREGDVVVVRTATGSELRLRRGRDGRYGLLWRTEALEAERDRVFQALRETERAAELHRRRRALQRGAEGP